MNCLSYNLIVLKNFIKSNIKELNEIYEEYKDENSVKVIKWFNDPKLNKLIVECNKEENLNIIIKLIGKEWFKIFNINQLINYIIEKLILLNLNNDILLQLTIFTKIYLLYYYLIKIYNNLTIKISITEQRYLFYLVDNITNYLKENL